jgi:hypothetical protein
MYEQMHLPGRSELATRAIEQIVDPSAPPEERAERRRCLKCPPEFREDRVDLPEGEGKMNSAEVTPASDTHESHGLPLPTMAKEKKTAEELAAMIHHDLSQIEGCPQRGIKVSAYGLNSWNSMLTFGVGAGPVSNKRDLQRFCEIITERLRRLCDVY